MTLLDVREVERAMGVSNVAARDGAAGVSMRHVYSVRYGFSVYGVYSVRELLCCLVNGYVQEYPGLVKRDDWR